MRPTPNASRYAMDSMSAKDGLAFLEKQLEKVDSKILEPLASTDWARDMPVITGGGFIENVASIDVEYGTTAIDEDGLIADQTNDIPVMSADFGKTNWRVMNWANYMSVPYIEKEKFKNISLNIEDYLNKGIRLYFDKFVDKSVYQGIPKVGTTGLINNANITRKTAAPHTAESTDTTFDDKTPDEILADFNTLLTDVWSANDCSMDGMPNHILLPVKQFGSLVTRKVADDSGKSILTYVLENNIAKQQGVNLVISPSKWLKGAGTGNTDRMIAYVNNEDKVCFNMTSPLHRLSTEIRNLKYLTPYVAQISEVRFLYPTTVEYMDGI